MTVKKLSAVVAFLTGLTLFAQTETTHMQFEPGYRHLVESGACLTREKRIVNLAESLKKLPWIAGVKMLQIFSKRPETALE